MIIKEISNNNNDLESESLYSQDNISSFSKVDTSENIEVKEEHVLLSERDLNKLTMTELHKSDAGIKPHNDLKDIQERSITSISKGILDLKHNIVKLSGYISNGDIKIVHGFIDGLQNSFNSILDIISECSNSRVNRILYEKMMCNVLEGHKKHQKITSLDVLNPTFEFLAKIVQLNNKAPKELKKMYPNTPLSKYKFEYRAILCSYVDSFHDELLYNNATMCTFYKLGNKNNPEIQFISRDAHYSVENIYLKAFRSIVSSVPKCPTYKDELRVFNEKLITLETKKSLPFCSYKNSKGPKDRDREFYIKNELIGSEISKHDYLNHVWDPNEKNMCFDKHYKDLNQHCTHTVKERMKFMNDSINTQEELINSYFRNPSIECRAFAMDKDPKRLPHKRPDIFMNSSASKTTLSNLTPLFLIISLIFIFLIKKWL